MQTKEDYERALSEIKQMEEILLYRRCLPHKFGFPEYSWSRRAIESKNKEIFITSANQIGKDLEENEVIPTTLGFKKMKDIQIGDFVFSMNGFPVKVIDIPYVGVGPGLRLTFTDGSSVVCGPNHDWLCKGSRQRFRKSYPSKISTRLNDQYGKWVVKSAAEIAKHYNPTSSNYERHCVPICSSVQHSSQQLFDPYAIGFLIGNGSLSTPIIRVTINSLDKDVSDFFKTNHGAKQSGKIIDYRLPLEVRNIIVKLKMNTTGLYKSIPPEYLLANNEQRLNLLRGLMDSDGTVDKRGTAVSYTTISKQLAHDFKQLVHSLGRYCADQKA